MTFPFDKKKFPSLAEEVAENLEMVGWITHNKLEGFLKQFKLTPQQYNVLCILREARGILPTLEISRRMFQKLPDITRLIDRLEKAKHVTRERLTTDRRVVMVSLTPEGYEVLKKTDTQLDQFCSKNLEHMTNEELMLLNNLILKVCEKEI